MFYRDPQHIYRVSELDSIPWLVHGFGTRFADVPALITPLATVKQIHSADCVVAAGRSGVLGEADALLEDTPGTAVAVKTADCIPILLVDVKRRAVAAVHAGWRGTVARIGPRALDAMRERFGTDADDVVAAVGPGIGPCCYEVGPDVAAQFGKEGRVRLDLAEENRRQLSDAGIPTLHVAGMCTRCGDEFHSFRRDAERAGRMYSFVGIRA
ncbi:MAG: peptidoglycan editing factor PgeF [Paludibaculum sp.]